MSKLKLMTTETKPEETKERVKKSPEQRMEKRMDRMTKNLSLSETQAAKIKKVQEDYAVKEKVAREVRKARRADQEAKIKAILTPEQAEKFEAAKAERKKRGKNKKGFKGKKSRKDSDTKEELVPDGQN